MDAILLAAGNSSRFGENKLLYRISGKPMYQHVLDHMYTLYKEGKFDHLLIVTQYTQIMKKVEKEYADVILVENHDPQLGISHSIYLGIEQLEQLTARTDKMSEACLFAVSDQPYLKLSSLRGLLQAWQEAIVSTKAGIMICTNKERMGNPVIFHRRFYEELKQLDGDVGGKRVVKSHKEDTIRYQISERELEDIDVKDMAATNE